MEIRSQSQPTDLDAPIAAAYEADPEGAIKVRVQPTVYIPGTGKYSQWKRVIWNLAFTSFDEAQAFRLLLGEFFTALALVGPTALRVHLASLRAPVDDKAVRQ